MHRMEDILHDGVPLGRGVKYEKPIFYQEDQKKTDRVKKSGCGGEDEIKEYPDCRKRH